MRLRWLVLLAVAYILAACGGDQAVGEAERVDPTTSTTATYAPDLMGACQTAARGYEGVAVAAFEDPLAEGIVVCWADGHIAKSPPPNPDGSAPPTFDRLVFTATIDGQFVDLLRAGYSDRLAVSAP